MGMKDNAVYNQPDNEVMVKTNGDMIYIICKDEEQVQILPPDDLSSRVKIDGNVSVSAVDISQIKIQLKEKDGKLYPSPIGDKLSISELNAHYLHRR